MARGRRRHGRTRTGSHSTPASLPPLHRRAGNRLWDAATGLAGGLWLAGRGVAFTWRSGLGRCAAGVVRAAFGDLRGGAAELGRGLGKVALQAPVDVLLTVGGRLVSALQTAAGLEPPARPLSADEVALLRSVFGGGLEVGRIRLKEGRIGLLGLPHRAFTHADLVFVPWRWEPEQAESRAALLVHEAVHVWQHRRRGTGYMSEALVAQWFGAGYNFAVGLAAGKRWRELNPEQQAEMVERAFSAGFVGPRAVPGARFLVKLVDPRRDHGFAVRVVAAGDPLADELQAGGYRDCTGAMVEALSILRGEAVT